MRPGGKLARSRLQQRPVSVFRRINNILDVLSLARRGVQARDKILIFCIVAFGSSAANRIDRRRKLLSLISKFGNGGLVTIQFTINHRPVVFLLRQGNEADCSVAAEMLKGGYKQPDFEPDQIIDGGANIGLFTVVASALFPRAKVTCYEPDSNNYALLCRTMEINSIDAECHQKGLWSHDATLYYRKRNSHTGNICEDPEGRFPVECVRPAIGPNCWLKLDIEASEYVVLPAILDAGLFPDGSSVEIHNWRSRNGRQLTQLLKRNGYVVRGEMEPQADNEVTIHAFRPVPQRQRAGASVPPPN